MTTPGGVPNLPLGALTLETLAQELQDMSAAAMRKRAGRRFPTVFNATTGGNVLNDLTPFGILTRIWSEINALVAASSPSDITGPADLPPVMLNFLENLPFVGQFVRLIEALLGTYTGNDPDLLAIQELFTPIRGVVQAILGVYDGDDATLIALETLFVNVRKIVETFLAATGNDLTKLTEKIPVIGDLVETLTGIAGGTGTLDDLGTWAKNLPSIPVLVSTLTGEAPTSGASSLGLPSLQTWANNLLTQKTPVPAGNLFGTLPPASIGSIPVAHISTDTPNLLTQGTFNTPGTITAAEGWEWDGAVNQTPSGGGSAKVTCNGTARRLYSSQSIPVSGGDRIELSAFIKVAGFTGANKSVNVAIVPFNGTAPQPTIVLGEASTANLTAAATDWVAIGSGSPVTIAAGVTSVKVRLAVTDGATVGAVWFDNVRCAKAGLLGQDLVSNLPDAWNLIYQGAQGLLSTPTGKTVFDMFEALSNPTSLAQTVTNNFALLQDILNTDPGQVLGTVGLNGAPPPGLGAALADGNLSFDEVFSVLTYAAQGATSALNNALEGTKQTLTGLFDGFLGLFGISTTAKNNSLVNADNIQATAKAVYNGYFGVGGSGQIAEVSETMAEIRARIQQGYTLQSLTYNGGSRLVSLRASTDANFGNVSLLLHCDGADGSKYVPDSSINKTPFALGSAGNAIITNEQSKFGGSSIKFDGLPNAGAIVTTTSSSNFTFGTAAFTVEFWVFINSIADVTTLVDFRPIASNGAYPVISVGTDGTLNYYVNTDFRISSSASVMTTGVWHHVAVARSGTSTKLFLNGTQVGSTYTDSTNYLGADYRPLFSGSAFTDATSNNLNGYMDEIRITKGVARYTANFTPPTTAFPEANNKPTGGTFTLTFGANTTAALAYNATTADVQTALAGLASIGAGNVTVGGNAGGPYTVTLRSNVASGTLSVTPSLTATSYATADVQNGWVRPWTDKQDAPKEFYCILFGSGAGGGAGESRVLNTNVITYGGLGGPAGGYAAMELDASELPETVPYTIASGGLGSTSNTNYTNRSESSFGSYLTSIAGEQTVTSLLGYFSTPLSTPGAGGGGGQAYTVQGVKGANGVAGATTKLAGGGAGGIGSGATERTPTPGAAGANASLTGKARAGGGGGGGGGAMWTFYAGYYGSNTAGQLGGNGGFPGGGGGGGGSAFVYDQYSYNPAPRSPGNGGNGANGVVVLIWK
jgi:hypothetical protein